MEIGWSQCALLVWPVLLMLSPNYPVISSQAINFDGENSSAGLCTTKDGEVGECRELFSCPAVVATFRRKRPAICGFRGMAPIVCCPNPLSTREQAKPASSQPNISPPKIDFECGRRQGRTRPPVRGDVIGGMESAPNSWPWMAAVGRLEQRGQVKWFCDGILITPIFVLSAAHCITYSSVDLVRLGAHNLGSHEVSQMDIRVLGAVIHPQYRPLSSNHDLTLLRLGKPAPLSPQVSPVCLPWTSQDAPQLLGRGLTLTGWGATTYGGGPSKVLREVVVTVFPTIRCDTSYSRLGDYSTRFPGGIDDKFLCAGNRFGGKDACQGDSGGPLVYNVFGRYVLAGVVTSGQGCGQAAFPGIYAAAEPHLQWLKDVAFSQYT